MATKVNAKDVSDNTDEANDAPLAGQGNLADAVKKLLKKGKERGVITLDELNAVLPPERISSEFIEDVMAQLNDMGINVVENEDENEGEAPAEGAVEGAVAETTASEDYGRTDDPVRLYLREMGAVELLSREGEIAIAKRIEAGREMMISGICDSPLTIQAILDWNEALKEGRLLLRDIIDLEATQESPESAAEGMPSAGSGELADTEGEGDKATDEAAETEGEGEGDGLSSFDDEDNISLAAIEEKLKPQVIDTFDKIAATYGKLGKLQHQRLLAIEKGEEAPRQTEAKIDGYRGELVELVRTIRFNNARLEQLVQQLYTLNRRLMGLEGRLLRLAVDVGLGREEFLERYYGHEHDPHWFDHIMQLPPVPAPPEPKVITPRPQRIDPKAAERAAKEAAKLESQRKAAEEKAAKAAASAAAKAQKQADKEAAVAAKEAAKEAARLAREKEAAQKQARMEAEREKALKLKAREAEARQRELDKKRAAAEKAAAQKQRERDKAQAAREKAAAQKERERAKVQAAREKAAAQRQRELDKKRGITSKKPAVKKAPAKKPAPKKAPAKKAPARPVRKPAGKPAKKTASRTVARSSKPAAKKAPAKKAAAKPAKKPVKGKKR